MDLAGNTKSAVLEELERRLRPHAKYKERSYEESGLRHLALLKSHPLEPAIVLFGDSVIERMTTTGEAPSFHPWPSATMLDDLEIKKPYRRLNGVFNAGVGGDGIENMIYRLIGDNDETRPLRGLAEVLHTRNVRLWVVSAGTVNLHPKEGLRDPHVHKMQLLLDALLVISGPTTKVVFSGLTYQRRVPDHLVDEANRKLKDLISSMNQGFGFERIEFLPPAATLNKEHHLADAVHLNLSGYRVWAKVLAPRVMELYESISSENMSL